MAKKRGGGGGGGGSAKIKFKNPTKKNRELNVSALGATAGVRRPFSIASRPKQIRSRMQKGVNIMSNLSNPGGINATGSVPGQTESVATYLLSHMSTADALTKMKESWLGTGRWRFNTPGQGALIDNRGNTKSGVLPASKDPSGWQAVV